MTNPMTPEQVKVAQNTYFEDKVDSIIGAINAQLVRSSDVIVSRQGFLAPIWNEEHAKEALKRFVTAGHKITFSKITNTCLHVKFG